jgi:predicted dehydrogenase
LSPIGVGVIGLGRHGMRYVRSLLMPLTGARLVAVCRRDQTQGAAFAGEHRLRYYPDFHDLIADPEVQAVVVVTPPNLTRSICLEAVKWNKPMLIEKPLATNGEDARAMVTAAADAGLPLMTAHTVRYEAAVAALREKLPSVGDRRYLVLSNRVEPHPDLMSERSNYGERGVLLETGIHLLDLVRLLTGEEAVQVSCHMERVAPGSPEHRALAHIHLSGEFSCVVDSSRVTGGRVSRAEWVGEMGQLAADWVHHRVWRITSRDVLEEWRVENRPTVVTVLEAFLQALTHEIPIPITGVDGQRAVELADACYLSDEKGGQWVRL